MKCIVCKLTKGKGEGRQRWVFSSERTPMLKVQLVFKLYELTKREFPAGSVCSICFDLVAQYDTLECQMNEVTKSLKSRVNCCATEEDYLATHMNNGSDQEFDPEEENLIDEEVEEEFEKPPSQSQAAHENFEKSLKRRKLENSVRMKLKQEKPDYDDERSDVALEQPNAENDVDMNQYLSVEQHIKKEKEDPMYPPPNVAADCNSGGPSSKSKDSLSPNYGLNKSAENLDFNLMITRTTRGHDQLVYESYTYLKTTQQPSQNRDITRWKCTSYYATKTGCRAKLHTTMNGMCVLLDSLAEHNHPPPDEKQLKIILFREQVKQIANNHPEMKPMEILTNAQMLLDTPTTLGLKDESIMRYIQRVKCKYKQQQQQQQTVHANDTNQSVNTSLKSEVFQSQLQLPGQSSSVDVS